MSLITDFPFAAFMADLKTRHTVEQKTGLSLALLTSEDMEAIAAVEVRAPCREESVAAPWEPVRYPGGEHRPTFYDTRMGNFCVKGFPTRPCATCGAAAFWFSGEGGGSGGATAAGGSKTSASASALPSSSSSAASAAVVASTATGKNGNERCSGHFGYVGMPRKFPLLPARQRERSHVINPHLFSETLILLRSQCFFCHRFRAPVFDVERYRLALLLADAGLPGDALEFLEVVMNSRRLSRTYTYSTTASAVQRERMGQLSTIDDMREVVLLLLQKHHVVMRKEEEAAVLATSSSSLPEHTADSLVKKEDEEKIENEDADRKPEAWMKLFDRGGESSSLSSSSTYRLASFDVRYRICHEAFTELQKYPLECSHCHCCSPSIRVHNGHLFFHFGKEELGKNIAQGSLTPAILQQWEGLNALHERRFNAFYTEDVRQHLKALCQQEGEWLGTLFPRMGEATMAFAFDAPLPPNMLYKVFFLDKLLVPPLSARLSSGVQVDNSGRIVPDDCTRRLSLILKSVEQIERYYMLRANIAAAATSSMTAETHTKGEDEDDHGEDTTVKNSETPSTRRTNTSQKKSSNHLRSTSSSSSSGPTAEQERIHERNLQDLQTQVNELYHSMMDSFAKKDGLYRMNMMGKRVNQACRSVISPDYLVESNELLLPRTFARRLTYPEQVSMYAPARAALLQRCAINGPDMYPGATHLEWRSSSGEVAFVELRGNEVHRRQQVNRYFAMAQQSSGSGGTHTLILHRHILDGDRVVLNRQPTLHKVSMMAYRAKVLSGLKTIRFHYINSKSYNADFDGDEMNVHVPQSLEAKAEMDCIMDADLQYLLPTSGKPIRGLIQDHLVAALLLTMRDKFYDRETFIQLVFVGLCPYLLQQQQQQLQLRWMRFQEESRASTTPNSGGTMASLIPLPAILWPTPLWTGKQLVTVIIRFVTGVVGGSDTPSSSTVATPSAPCGNDGLHLTSVSLIQPSVYTHTDLDDPTLPLVTPSRPASSSNSTIPMDDSRVLVRHSALLTGMLDKNQLGPSSLSIPHLIHEGYGAAMVGRLLTALGRVLIVTLQAEGFSMGIDDMMLVREDRRSALLEALDLAPLTDFPAESDRPSEENVSEANVLPRIMHLASELQKEYIPGRLLVPFPKNQLILMTASGAKGSSTNAIQMALGLGQQLFDGRRVLPMNSGKTLPAFFIGDRRARCFGYAMGRFASGIRPAEYTIHAMAGRDGLIDTAVKTSRSGHLQRCLIKGLEGLITQWDHSVREVTNGEVYQFQYGGDGLDPIKASTLRNWEVVKNNAEDWSKRFGMDAVTGGGGSGSNSAGVKRLKTEDDEAGGRPRAVEAGGIGSEVPTQHPITSTTPAASILFSSSPGRGKRERLDDAMIEWMNEKRAALYRHAHLSTNGGDEGGDEGSSSLLPSHLQQSLRQYLQKSTTAYPLFKKVSQVERWIQKGMDAATTTPAAYLHERLLARRQASIDYYEDVLRDITVYKRARSFSEAGEPVGILAAQAAGEPSTQMTLNTFHSAGATVTHVTEGIPRLRELLLYASVKHAAVVVPVEQASVEEEALIAKILRVGPVCKVADCLARVAPPPSSTPQSTASFSHARTPQTAAEAAAKGYHYRVFPPSSYSGGATVYVLSFLFSYAGLEYARETACMSREEHVQYFRQALRSLTKQIVSALSGSRREEGEGNGGLGGEMEEDEEGAWVNEGKKRGAPRDVLDEDEDEEEGRGRRSKRLSSLRDGEDDANDGSSSSSEEEDEEVEEDNGNDVDEEDDDDDARLQGVSSSSAEATRTWKKETKEATLKRSQEEREKKKRKHKSTKRRRMEEGTTAEEEEDDEDDSASSSSGEDDDDDDDDEEEKTTMVVGEKGGAAARRGKKRVPGNGDGTTTGEDTKEEKRSTAPDAPSFSSPSDYYSHPTYVNDHFSLRSNRFTVWIRPRTGQPCHVQETGGSHTTATPSSSQEAQRREAHAPPEEETSSFFPSMFHIPLPPLPHDFFVVEIQIHTKSPHIVVIPDVMDRILETLEFPSWLPRFDSVTFTRKAEDAHSGELVFQGRQATLTKVIEFLSVLSVAYDGSHTDGHPPNGSPPRRRSGGGGGGIQLHKARSTNIHHMIERLGVESGYRALLDELTKLFKRYAVDYHHLTLIADAATHRGSWENFNFTGIISHSASPLFQMTVASSKKFLHTAITQGVGDHLNSLSASLMVGEKPKVGTACVQLSPNPVMLPDILERQFVM